MRTLFLVILCILFVPGLSSAQNDSCSLHISLLTCAPGEELYATFGHTALRVKDEASGTDAVFNYGTFEFSPDFNIKFIRGKLLYALTVEDFNDFLYTYQLESRSVQEQVLLISCAEKQKLWEALKRNGLPQYRYYRYDFLFDNCTTRAGDMVTKNTYAPVRFQNILPPATPTFRDLIHSYLDAGHESWSKLGIDILLGAPMDRKVTNRTAMFLPDYLLKGFDRALVNGHRLAAPPQTILDMPSSLKQHSWLTPAVVFSFLLVIALVLSFTSWRPAARILSILDFLFFFILGLAGLLLVFMWLGTDHQVCRYNFNLLWALPTHAVMAFFIYGRKRAAGGYFKAVAWLGVALMLAWFFLPQQLNPALIPVLLLIIFRSWMLAKNHSDGTENN